MGRYSQKSLKTAHLIPLCLGESVLSAWNGGTGSQLLKAVMKD